MSVYAEVSILTVLPINESICAYILSQIGKWVKQKDLAKTKTGEIIELLTQVESCPKCIQMLTTS